MCIRDSLEGPHCSSPHHVTAQILLHLPHQNLPFSLSISIMFGMSKSNLSSRSSMFVQECDEIFSKLFLHSVVTSRQAAIIFSTSFVIFYSFQNCRMDSLSSLSFFSINCIKEVIFGGRNITSISMPV